MTGKAEPLKKKRRFAWAGLLLVLLAGGAYVAYLAIPRDEYFLERHGVLVHDEVTITATGGVLRSLVRLESSSGLVVDMRVARPATGTDELLPVIVMLGGEGTGRDAVDLVGKPVGVAYVALDYPYDGDQELDAFWESIAAVPGIQQAFLDSPPALMLALDWVSRQAWFDPDRVELVGASLGVPFTAVAGALDERFTRVWLLHGGARNLPWLMHAGERYVANEFLRGVVARSALLLVHGTSFETMDWIEGVAPRPLVIVAARDDDFVPADALQPFVEAAERSEYIEMLWTEGRHVAPSRKKELEQLLDLVLSRVLAPGYNDAD